MEGSQEQKERNTAALQTLSEETGREQGANDQSQPTSPTSDSQPVTQEEETASKQEDSQTSGEGKEEDHRAL